MIPETPTEIVEFMLNYVSETEAKQIIEKRITELKQQPQHAEELEFFQNVQKQLNNNET